MQPRTPLASQGRRTALALGYPDCTGLRVQAQAYAGAPKPPRTSVTRPEHCKSLTR